MPDQTIQRFAGNLASKMTVWIRSQFIFGRFQCLNYFRWWSVVRILSENEKTFQQLDISTQRLQSNNGRQAAAGLCHLSLKKEWKYWRKNTAAVWGNGYSEESLCNEEAKICGHRHESFSRTAISERKSCEYCWWRLDSSTCEKK